MKKRTPKENLKSFSWIYIIVAAFYFVGVLICNLVPELSTEINEAFGKYGILVFDITAGVVILAYLWYFWLAGRVVSGKSKGTLFMVLLMLGVVGSIVNFFTTKSVGKLLSFDFIVDLCGLYYLYRVKNEN